MFLCSTKPLVLPHVEDLIQGETRCVLSYLESISLALTYFEYTKVTDTTTRKDLIQRDTKISVRVSHWHNDRFDIRKLLRLPQAKTYTGMDSFSFSHSSETNITQFISISIHIQLHPVLIPASPFTPSTSTNLQHGRHFSSCSQRELGRLPPGVAGGTTTTDSGPPPDSTRLFRRRIGQYHLHSDPHARRDQNQAKDR